MRNRKGFTLVELVIVIVVLGILAAVAMPKFVDLVDDAKEAATKGGLGAIRSVIVLKYSKNLADGLSDPYPSSVLAADFFDGKLPVNKLNDKNAVEVVTAAPGGTATSTTSGWWYIATTGVAGAYSDGGTRDTSTW